MCQSVWGEGGEAVNRGNREGTEVSNGHGKVQTGTRVSKRQGRWGRPEQRLTEIKHIWKSHRETHYFVIQLKV